MPIQAGVPVGQGPAYAAPWTGAADELLTIGAITMSGLDEFGVRWTLRRLDGWWDGWESESQLTRRSAAHGAWPNLAWAGPRLVQVDGVFDAGTWDAATLAWERLMVAVPTSDLTVMTVFTGEGGVPIQQAQVRQGGKPTMSRTKGIVEFTVALIAPDPRRYSVTEVTASTGLPVTTGGMVLPLVLPLAINATAASGILTVVNDGNIDAPVTLVVAGPSPASASITNVTTGQRIAIPEALTAGRTLVLNSDTRTALLDGVSLRTVTGTWFDLAPGPNQIAFTAPSYDAAAQLTVRYRHAWR